MPVIGLEAEFRVFVDDRDDGVGLEHVREPFAGLRGEDVLLASLLEALERSGIDPLAWVAAWARLLPSVLLIPAFGLRGLPALGRVLFAFFLAGAVAPAAAWASCQSAGVGPGHHMARSAAIGTGALTRIDTAALASALPALPILAAHVVLRGGARLLSRGLRPPDGPAPVPSSPAGGGDRRSVSARRSPRRLARDCIATFIADRMGA